MVNWVFLPLLFSFTTRIYAIEALALSRFQSFLYVSSGYQTVMPNQQQNYQNVIQPPQNQTLVSSQHSNMGSQMQGMMVQYLSMPSYQVNAAFWEQNGLHHHRAVHYNTLVIIELSHDEQFNFCQ